MLEEEKRGGARRFEEMKKVEAAAEKVVGMGEKEGPSTRRRIVV